MDLQGKSGTSKGLVEYYCGCTRYCLHMCSVCCCTCCTGGDCNFKCHCVCFSWGWLKQAGNCACLCRDEMYTCCESKERKKLKKEEEEKVRAMAKQVLRGYAKGLGKPRSRSSSTSSRGSHGSNTPSSNRSSYGSYFGSQESPVGSSTPVIVDQPLGVATLPVTPVKKSPLRMEWGGTTTKTPPKEHRLSQTSFSSVSYITSGATPRGYSAAPDPHRNLVSVLKPTRLYHSSEHETDDKKNKKDKSGHQVSFEDEIINQSTSPEMNQSGMRPESREPALQPELVLKSDEIPAVQYSDNARHRSKKRTSHPTSVLQPDEIPTIHQSGTGQRSKRPSSHTGPSANPEETHL